MNLNSRERIGLGVLLLFHVCGVIGILSPLRDLFLMATPLTLLVSLCVLLWGTEGLRKPFYGSLITVGILGIMAEVLGVATGLVFGEYSYGQTLGWQIGGVPWVIGMNWALLVWASLALGAYLGLRGLILIVAAASILVGFDWVMEPVAMNLDFGTGLGE